MDTTPELVTLDPTPTAVVRETVPMAELTAFFDRAFTAVMAAIAEQGAVVTGPAFALYLGMPTETVELEAGFPTDREVSPGGGVVPSTLPGGRAGRLLHIGSYDSLEQAYGRLMGWLGEQGLTPGQVMWESYLNEPEPDGDPDANQTLITWPVEG